MRTAQEMRALLLTYGKQPRLRRQALRRHAGMRRRGLAACTQSFFFISPASAANGLWVAGATSADSKPAPRSASR